MTPIDFFSLQMTAMQVADLDDVMAIESAVYSHPWSRNNFIESMVNNYDAWVVRGNSGELLGYFVHMTVVDESHLLTVAVNPTVQRQGLGKFLLQQLILQVSRMQLSAVLLEVRVSNSAAIKLYESAGFVLVGRRKNYYQIDRQQREDALVLRFHITEQQSKV